jgi:hypothetical protein
MSTQFSKRELTAGLGVGALALLAQTQRASADTPFTTFPFAATGAPTPRTMPDRLGEIKNVKDYGAVGDGVTNDTAAIQSCFDAAFGTAAQPNGGGNVGLSPNHPYLNKAVYFPPGHYKVGAPAALTVTATANNGGNTKCTVGSTSGWSKNWIVDISGGTGGLANGSFGIVSIDDATHLTITQAFTSTGTGTIKTAALHLTGVYSGMIYGAGRNNTVIETLDTTTSTAVISTNQMSDTTWYDLAFKGNADINNLATTGQVGFDYNWDGRSLGGNGSQTNSWVGCRFENIGNPSIGFRAGNGQAQCDSCSFFGCWFAGKTLGAAGGIGFACMNFNSLNHCFYGGQFASHDVHIKVLGGSVSVISGCEMQGSNTFAIDLGNEGAVLATVVEGIRTEDLNFITCANTACQLLVLGCTQAGANTTTFVFSRCATTIMNCTSEAGNIQGGNSSAFTVAVINSIQGVGTLTEMPITFGTANRILHWPVRATVFTDLPSSPKEGMTANITDATVNTFGANVTVGGGANHVKIRHNGTNWTVCGI